MSQGHQIAFVLIVCSAQFLSLGGMNQTVAPVMILAEYFHIHDYGTLSWFSAAYSMTVGTFILPAGRLGDMYGHKKVFLIGWAWFSMWSLISGFCYRWGVVVFSVCRAFQGMGPALIVPNAIALIGRNFPIGVKRNTVFACFGAAGPTGATAGAVFSALIAELYWWPWCFWILSAVCLCVMAMTFCIIPNEEGPLHPPGIDRPTFDYLGSLTGVTGLILINFALNQAPLAGWATPYIPAILTLGVVSMAIFVWVELYITPHPLIPIRGLGFEALFALACIAAGWGSHGIWAYYLYLFLEHLRGHSALLTAAETSPVAITGVFFAFSTVWLLRRIAVSWVMLIAMLFFLLGALLMALAPLHQTYWAQTFVSVMLMPGAMNLSFPAATILLSTALPKEKQGIAASLVSTMVNYSISCGLGFAGSVHRYTIGRTAKRLGVEVAAPLGDATADVIQARLTGLRGAYWFAVGLSGLGVLVAGAFILVSKRKERARVREEGRG
ncbi:MFS general substrate transporter [Mytilinidion resinicola]|uniref:MFS general substrate transporter n=1 Tax=Mytilinidion resinicola TaxID=574789 RepID=A0A6A6YC53_9PEZI|nr:MFS general substrate transporter [Mytilinidion resinicola]KAF2806396.1 MFS general substrate transporter [Mytilinidion resinicola]